MTRLARDLAGKSFFAAAILAFGLIGQPNALQAQGMGDRIANLTNNSDKPIDIEADTLEVLDAEKRAIFKGNVKASQGGMTLRTRQLAVSYSGEQGLSGSSSKITRIRADGKVLIETETNQTATSDWADFEVVKQVMTIGGNVVLSQGENVIKGDRLVIDLKTGHSRFENEGQQATPGRVRGIFTPNQLGSAKKGNTASQGETAAPAAPAADLTGVPPSVQ